MHSLRGALAAFITAGVLTACSNGSNGVNTADPGTVAAPSVSAPATTTTPVIDPAAQPAVDAYLAFSTALNAAERKPWNQNEVPPQAADFTPSTVDPLEIDMLTYVWGLKANDLHYDGTLPVQHVEVAAIDLEAADHPTVILTDCQTDDGWELYQGTSTTPLPDATAKVPPPYTAKITVIEYKKAWAVKELTVDQSQTCAA